MTAALNLALIVTVGSGLSEARTYDKDNKYNVTPSTTGANSKRFGSADAAGDNLSTTV